jgi:1-deoxy-D-xylulose-5-phosphate reductoisomerase
MPCVLNAANEIAVQAFLEDKVGFLEMSDLVEHALSTVAFIKQPSLNDYMHCDSETRRLVQEKLGK